MGKDQDYKEEQERNRHEYTLMEFRLMIEDVKSDHREALADLLKETIVPMREDVTVLKTSYGFIYAGLGLIGMAVLYIGYWIFGHVQEASIVAKHMAFITKHIRWWA